MADIIKTWPAIVPAKTVAQIFSPRGCFTHYYFTLGRGRPRQPIEHLFFTYKGRILGSFDVEQIACNDGTLPKLRRLDGGESEWQIRKDAWVAICRPGCHRLRDRVFMDCFRGFRYFDLEQWRQTPDSRHRF